MPLRRFAIPFLAAGILLPAALQASPDGRWVAFVVSEADEEENAFNSDLYLAPAAGGADPIRLTRSPKADNNPRWKPDGSVIAFLSAHPSGRNGEKDEKGRQVWLIRPDGDIPPFMRSYFQAWPWEDQAIYITRTAIFNTKGVSTPTLIQHGESEDRVPISQGRELHVALKEQNVPVEFVTYPRQKHAITEAKLIRDAMKRNVEWFSRWILGKSGS